MSKIRLRETLAGVGVDGEIVEVCDPDWYVSRGFGEPVAVTAVEQRETAVSVQAVTRTRRGRKKK
jgi:hypothetical protein